MIRVGGLFLACFPQVKLETIKWRRVMVRKFIDCRDLPRETNCSVAIFADTEHELIEAAVQHAIIVHGQEDTPELRAQLIRVSKIERRHAA